MEGIINLDDIWKDYGLDTLEEGLAGLFPGGGVSLEELLLQVFSGDLSGAAAGLMGLVTGDLGGRIASMKNILIWLIVMGMMSSLISYFAGIFDRQQVADLGFYVMYLLLSAVLLRASAEAAGVAADTIGRVVLFMKLLLPTYMLAVGVVTGITTVTAYYQLILILIYGVESVLMAGVMPLVQSYCLLSVVNGIWVEEKLGMLIRLLGKGIGVLLKTALSVVTGVGLLQAVLTPAIDSMKSSVFKKIITAIPGIGNGAESVIDLLGGTALLLKNGLGIVLLLLLAAMCAAPLLHIAMIAWTLKIAAAFMGIVGDKRLTACTDRVGESSMLIFRTAGTAILLFAVTLSIVTVTVRRTV